MGKTDYIFQLTQSLDLYQGYQKKLLGKQHEKQDRTCVHNLPLYNYSMPQATQHAHSLVIAGRNWDTGVKEGKNLSSLATLIQKAPRNGDPTSSGLVRSHLAQSEG